MKFVPETIIDEVAENIGASESAFEAALTDMEAKQPVLFGYLFSENFSLFTDHERDFLLFLVVVVYGAASRVNGDQPPIQAEPLSLAEERNWEMLQKATGKGFHERLDVFFQDHPQEDLLAFAEDSLSDVEDGYVTKEGREAIFVSVKSVIDAL